MFEFSFDAAKGERNLVERGLPFSLAGEFDWSGALIEKDQRRDYGEDRSREMRMIGDRLFHRVFTPRGTKVHIISLRKANAREAKRYEKKIDTQVTEQQTGS